MSLHHNMPSEALNNQLALKNAYLQNTEQEGNMNYALSSQLDCLSC